MELHEMNSNRRSDKQPLLNHQSLYGRISTDTETIQKPINTQCNKWKTWITTISIILAIVFILFYAIANDGISWLQHSPNNSKSLEIKSYLSEERIAKVHADTGLSAAAKSDLITYLPGLQVDINDLNYHMYSGYVDVNENEYDDVDSDVQKQIFYWFFEADTDDDTADEQPLLLWTNGGPGCSGMDGLLTEHGALLVNDDLELYVNDYAWNNYANVIYIEQPYGVGFSLPGKGEVVSGDNNAATDMHSFLQNFLITYPKYEDTEVYISSESWGGHYIPLTAFTILNKNAQGSLPYINFGGFLLGNPYTEYYENWIGFMEALYGHGLMKQTTYETWRSDCYGQLPDETSAVCTLNYIEAFVDALGVDWYALDFPDCDILEKGSLATTLAEGKFKKTAHIHARRAVELYDSFKDDATFNALLSDSKRTKIDNYLSRVRDASGSIAYYACVDDYMASYLNTDTVQSALHTKEDAVWAMCSDDVYYAWPDSDWVNGVETVYHSIFNDFSDEIKMVLYSGDDDSVCGTAGTQYWLRNMGWEIPEDEDWKEWRYEDELAGFYTKFTHPDRDVSLYLQTVRSAGHMVPQTQPKRSLELVNRFLNFF